MADNTILVTGGLGYIGAITSTLLMEEGYDVLIVDNLLNATTETLGRIEGITGRRPGFIELDLIHQKEVDQLFSIRKDIKGIVHFAAAKSVGESVEKPLFYYRNNLVPMMNLLECMKKYEVNNFVFSSSCTVYGQPEVLPVTENEPIKEAYSPYGYTNAIKLRPSYW